MTKIRLPDSPSGRMLYEGIIIQEGTSMESDTSSGKQLLLFFPALFQLIFTAIVGALFTLMLFFGQPVE